MKKNLVLLLLFFVVGCVNAQKNTEPEAPKESYSIDNATSEKLVSTISIPFSITLVEIEKQINNSITGLIYEDNSYDDHNTDNLKMKVWKNGQIKFTANKNDVFEYNVPLKVWANYQVSVFGIKQDKSTTFEMNLNFSSRFMISPDWSLQTITSPKGFEFVSEPRVVFSSSISIPITPIISKIIANNHAFFARTIDESVKNEMSLKPQVIDAWNTLKKPYLVSEEYSTWMQITPLNILMSPLVSDGKTISSKIGFTAYTETITGQQPSVPEPVKSIPALKYTTNIPNDFKVAIKSIIPYSEATTFGKKMFVGETYAFKNGKYEIKVTDMEIYGSEENLIIRVETKGDLKGNIYVKGVPVYNPTKKAIELTNTQLDIKTKNILVKAASWILEGTLEKKIQENFVIPTEELITYTKTSIEESLNSEWMKGVKTQCKITSIVPNKVKLSKDGISTLVIATGNVRLDVNGL